MTRLQTLQASGQSPDMPLPCVADHLVEYLLDAGPVSSAGMGAAPLSHVEIAAWQSNTGIELNAWEASTLRRLSIEYVAQAEQAKDADCPQPYLPAQIDSDRRTRVAQQLRAAMSSRRAA
jgi:hypothetical protein